MASGGQSLHQPESMMSFESGLIGALLALTSAFTLNTAEPIAPLGPSSSRIQLSSISADPCTTTLQWQLKSSEEGVSQPTRAEQLLTG